MGELIELGGITVGEIPPSKVIAKAEEALDFGIIIGYDKDGEFYFASSKADAGMVLILIEKAKKYLMSIV
jgi:hypothetical protein